MWKIAIFLVGISRFILPFNIFSHPIFSSIASGFLDYTDCYLAFRAGFKWQQYHLYDKVMDYWWYIFIFLYSWNTEIRIVILILFVYRSIGQMVALITGNEKIFLYFPNVLEKYFFLYVISGIFPQTRNFFQGYNIIIPLFISFVLGIHGEYMIHIQKSSLFKKGAFHKFHKWTLHGHYS